VRLLPAAFRLKQAAGNKRTAKAIESEEAASAESSPNKTRKTKPTGFAPVMKVEPAAVREHTGRFTPINSQLKRAKKIKKRLANSDDTETATLSASEERQEDVTRFSPFSWLVFASFG
jgi:hypothetical protein